MSQGNSSDFRSGRITISVEKWANHARTKLSKGYVLVVNEDKGTATFFMPGRGYEACNYKAALSLVKAGEVIEDGKRAGGIKYRLAEGVAPPPKKVSPTRRPIVDDDDDDDDLDDSEDLAVLLEDLEVDAEEDEDAPQDTDEDAPLFDDDDEE